MDDGHIHTHTHTQLPLNIALKPLQKYVTSLKNGS